MSTIPNAGDRGDGPNPAPGDAQRGDPFPNLSPSTRAGTEAAPTLPSFAGPELRGQEPEGELAGLW